MNPPIIYQFRSASEKHTKNFFGRIIKTEYFFRKSNGEIREFNEVYTKKWLEYVNRCPKIGDKVYIECCYQIVNCFYNFNHDIYEIWIYPDLLGCEIANLP